MADVILRSVTIDDAPYLYDLLRTRPPEANISHRQMPTFDEHCAFIRSRPYDNWYLIIRHSLAGTIYITRQDEVGIHIHHSNARQGLATIALSLLMKANPRPRYLANISPHNGASMRMFASVGFAPIQITYEFRK